MSEANYIETSLYEKVCQQLDSLKSALAKKDAKLAVAERILKEIKADVDLSSFSSNPQTYISCVERIEKMVEQALKEMEEK